jgi:hypothetical protein
MRINMDSRLGGSVSKPVVGFDKGFVIPRKARDLHFFAACVQGQLYRPV